MQVFTAHGDKPFTTDQLLPGLTSESPRQRCFARLLASGFSDAVIAWVDAERERGTGPADIMLTLAEVQVQLAASISANFISEREGHAAFAKVFGSLIDRIFVDHAIAVGNEAERAAAQR